MKTRITINALSLSVVLLLASGCTKDDIVQPTTTTNGSDCGSATGYIHVQNASMHTVQRILIDNTNFGSLDPGQERYIEKVPGVYNVRLVGLTGGSGCSASWVHVAPCSVDGISCTYETGGLQD